MEKKWEVRGEDDSEKRHFPEMERATEQILLHRGLKSEQELDAFFVPDYEKDLHDPFLLKDMEKAVKRASKAIKYKEKIFIYGDYDADGVTASTLMVDFLRKEAGADVYCYIPDREKDGYGLSKKALDHVIKEGANLVITVDCGITSIKEVEYAKKIGLDIIVLDHHNVIDKTPNALAVVDPKNPQEKKYPFRELAGVGVAFKFLQALANKDSSINKDALKWYLDLVAVGTIADCVPLVNENRILVKFGLMVLAKTKRAGFRQLFQNGRMRIGEGDLPTATQVAFQIAPRINAAGRMKHANIAYELLMETDEAKAAKLAKEVEEQNKKRQKVTAEIIKSVRKEINSLETIPKVIIRSSADWKIGIVGLSAGRLMEEYARPVLILQEKGDVLRGSGRSIPEFNLVEALERQEKLLERFGGHKQAAGLTVKKNNFKEFEKAFTADVRKRMPKKIVKKLDVDVKLNLSEVNKKLCEELLWLEPFGKGNELPLLMVEGVEIINKKLLGNSDKHLKLWVSSDNVNGNFEAIGFGMGSDSAEIKQGDKIDLLFNLEKNNWNGSDSLQLKIVDYKKTTQKESGKT